MANDVEQHLRIGELARRVGVKPELLRAWERRYGLLRPERTPGGLRLYSPEDERSVRLMQARLGEGLSAAEAARLVLAGEGGPATDAGTPLLDRDAGRLRDALDRLDADEANAALDRLLASFLLDTVLAEVVLPYLRDLGDRWEHGSASVAQEHFASNLLRARLAALARGWEAGGGPRALLACAPGELHDLPLLIFGLALRARGWRIVYLGADTPGESLLDASRELDPALVVMSAVLRSRFRRAAPELAAVAEERPLAVAGAGATESLAESLGCTWLAEGPVDAAERVAAEARTA
ncbi:MAG TPA: MerR family transcriptional regulator [Thermoleophilaceae bacterium]|nr:MerR family transcriptional regulator [Thermoleophilaceae bacterium]